MGPEVSAAAKADLLNHSVDVLTVLDDAGVIQYESPSLRRMFGYDPDELIGENVFEYIHPDDRQVALETFRDVIASSTGYTTESIELRFRHKNDGWVWIETRGANEKSSAIGGYVVTSREITARKEYERELKRERDRLKRLTSILSHDLRNPLNVAEAHLEFAQEERESDHLDAVARSHDRMEALIGDLLTLAREGGSEPQLDAVCLRTLAETCWEQVATKDARLRIKTELDISADTSQCQRLLENLIRNAVEHGGEAVTVSIGDCENGFYFEDDGRGLPDTNPEVLVEYGYSTTEDGTGMGLSIVNEVVENHGWSLTVLESEDGGARFEIRNVRFV